MELKAAKRGYDTPQLFYDDLLERIRQDQLACNESVKQINRMIQEGHLPEPLVPLPFPEAEDDDPEYE